MKLAIQNMCLSFDQMLQLQIKLNSGDIERIEIEYRIIVHQTKLATTKDGSRLFEKGGHLPSHTRT